MQPTAFSYFFAFCRIAVPPVSAPVAYPKTILSTSPASSSVCLPFLKSIRVCAGDVHLRKAPSQRFCRVACANKDTMFVFRGYDGTSRLNDLLEFVVMTPRPRRVSASVCSRGTGDCVLSVSLTWTSQVTETCEEVAPRLNVLQMERLTRHAMAKHTKTEDYR